MRRSTLFDDEEARRQEYADLVGDEVAMIPPSEEGPEATRSLALRRLSLGGDPGPVSEPYEEPAPDPAPTMGIGRGGAPDLTARTGPKAGPTPMDPPEQDGGGFKLPSLGISKDADDRVSQALYSAFTRKPLDASFFTGPKQDRIRQDELAQKKSHNDFLKEQLRLKYAGKAGADPSAQDANSLGTRAFKSYLLGSEAHRPIVQRMMEDGTWESATKADLISMFGEGKQLAPIVGKAYVEGQKPGQIELRGKVAGNLEDRKFGHKQTLQDDTQEYDRQKTAYMQSEAWRRADAGLKQKQLQFDMALNQKQDAMALSISQKLPKEAKAVYDSGARIDSLVTKLGGPGNLAGVGLIEGSIPSVVGYEKEVISLRHEINDLVNAWNHAKFGGSFTADEIKRADAAVPMIKGWRSEDEVLDGVRLIRSVMQSNVDQAVGGASPEIKRRLLRYYMQGSPDLFGEKPEVNTTEQVQEPDAAQLEALGNSSEPAEIRVTTQPPSFAKKPATGPAMPQQPGAVTGGPQKGPTTPSGKPYFKKQHNAKLKATRFLDAVGNVVEEVSGLL